MALTAAHGALVAAYVALARADGQGLGSPARVLALAGAFALVGMVPMHLELGRSACSLTLVEAVLVLALYALGPLGVVVAAAAGEASACVLQLQSAQKVLYNTAATALGALTAALAFAAVAGSVPGGAASWWPALAAVGSFAVVGHASTSLVLAATGEGRFEDVWLVSVGLAAGASAVSGSVGLALHALSRQSSAAPFLMVPLIAVVGLGTRRAAAYQAERMRFERLAAATGRTTGLEGFGAALSRSATEARNLVTGSASICCAPHTDGVWRGVLVDDRGAHTAPEVMVAAVVRLAHGGDRELATDSLTAACRTVLPAGPSLVVAASGVPVGVGGPPPEGSEPSAVAIAVVRDIPGDGQGWARAQVLGAFGAHAALIATNARLLERTEEALRRQVDLNRQKDEFVAAVSHELRTPLASLLGSVDILRRLDGRLPDEARKRFLSLAHRQGDRLKRMIEELLLTASVEQHAEGVRCENVDVIQLLRDVSEDLAEQGAGRVVVRVDGPIADIRTDGEKLRRIVGNLAENATKYAPRGPIELRASRGAIGDAQLMLVRVVDHGPGIAPEDRARASERFVQLDGSSTRAQGGTGLGLYLCDRLALLLGATLSVGDTPGGGATFALSLPVDGPSADDEMDLAASWS